MKKSLLFMGGVIAGLSLHAQTLPNPVYTLTFEGATEVKDFGGVQTGDGALVQSEDPNFGTYYQNMPNGTAATIRKNYLSVKTNAFQKVKNKDTKEISIGFWVNTTYANQHNIADYWGSIFVGYSEAGMAAHAWPFVFDVRANGAIHGNNAGWYDNNHDDLRDEVIAWTKQKTKEETVTDEEGAETVVATELGFDENWTYITTVYTNLDNGTFHYRFYVDGELKIDTEETFNGTSIWANSFADIEWLSIGGNSPVWEDVDNAYAYDDVAIYATALTPDQIELIMDIKRGTLSEEDQIVVARGQLEAAKEELEDYMSELGDTYAKLSADVLDWLMEDKENGGIGDADDYQTVEDVNAAIAQMQKKQEEVQVIVNAYTAATKRIGWLTEYCDNTDYAGAAAFKTALTTATEAIANPTAADAIETALATLEQAKVTYVFTQTGEVIDVTRVINKPWFIEEAYEPVEGEGGFTYAEGASDFLSKDGWTMTASEELTGATDLAIYLTNGRSTANLFHSSGVANGVLDLQQTIVGLPAGYYELTADMSSTSDPTNNHLYATSDGVTKVSLTPSSSTYKWADGVSNWETLVADKVHVGEDGTLTIGATATTDGTAYKGWFCVTNFQLKYYGTEYDFSTDLADKKAEVEAAIETLQLKGDQADAKEKYEGVVNGEGSDYDKVSQLTVLIDEISSTLETENSFTRAADISALIEENSEDNAVASVYNMGYNVISEALEADDARISLFPALEELYAAYVNYASTIKIAEDWPSEEVTDQISVFVNAVSGATAEEVKEKQAELFAAMKASIPSLEASEADPKNITALIGNASFDNDQKDAWSVTYEGGTTDVKQGEVEFYNNASFKISQLITDMPKGTYKLTVSGFYRDGNDYAAVVSNYTTPAEEDSEETVYDTHANVTLVATTANFNVGTPLVSIASASVSFGAEDNDTYTDYYGNENHVSNFYTTLDKDADPVVYYPYWMWDAYDMITNRGNYGGNEVVFVISEEKADLTIGATKQNHIEGDWTILDNFQLFYLGQEIPTAIETVKEAAGTKAANGKYLENGRIVIIKNGAKYNVAGQTIK